MSFWITDHRLPEENKTQKKHVCVALHSMCTLTEMFLTGWDAVKQHLAGIGPKDRFLDSAFLYSTVEMRPSGARGHQQVCTFRWIVWFLVDGIAHFMCKKLLLTIKMVSSRYYH